MTAVTFALIGGVSGSYKLRGLAWIAGWVDSGGSGNSLRLVIDGTAFL